MLTGLHDAQQQSLVVAEAGGLAAAVNKAAAAAGSVKAMEVSPAHQRSPASALDALLDAAASAWAQDCSPSGTTPCLTASLAAAASHPVTDGGITTTRQAGCAKGSQAGNHRSPAKAEKSPAGAEAGPASTGQADIGSAHAKGTPISARPNHTASRGSIAGPVPDTATVPEGGSPAAASALQAQAGAFSQDASLAAAPDAGRIAGTSPQPDAGQPAEAPSVAHFPFPTFSGLAFMVQNTASWQPQGIADEPERRELAASLKRLGREITSPCKRR